jgi:uncharacterized protein (DUF1499 family)
MRRMRVNIASLGGIALTVALVAGLLLLISGPSYRIGILPLSNAFALLQWGAYGGLAAVFIAAIALWRAHGRDAVAALALVVGIVAFGIPLRFQRLAAAAPPIHDITTDTANPPTFQAIVPLRTDSPNSLEYSQDAARQQRTAYADIKPLILEVPAAQVFERALFAARDADWEIVEANADQGRIEATDTTTFFGFKDDIVVRLTPLGGRTVVDVRSVSRVGRGDAGTNARRVREFLDRLSRP